MPTFRYGPAGEGRIGGLIGVENAIGAYQPPAGSTLWEKHQRQQADERQRRIADEAAARDEASRAARFQRFSAFADPYLKSISAPATGAPGGVDVGTSPELAALLSTIESRGEQAQGRLASQLARRGIYRGGPSAKASAVLGAETEANVAVTRAGFVQEAARRAQSERASQRAAFAQIFGSMASQL